MVMVANNRSYITAITAISLTTAWYYSFTSSFSEMTRMFSTLPKKPRHRGSNNIMAGTSRYSTCQEECVPSIILSRWGTPPYIAVITEPDSCSSTTRTIETFQAMEQAVMSGCVNLVVLRVEDASEECDVNNNNNNITTTNKWLLLKILAELKNNFQFNLVVNNDVDIVLKALSENNIRVDGVHVKEHNAHQIPSIRKELKQFKNDIIIGTSCHSIPSILSSPSRNTTSFLEPDYLFVGTCYLTESHPEKTSSEQLEGPSLPGQVKEELCRMFNETRESTKVDTTTIHPITTTSTARQNLPIVFAIGGINEQNCQEPVVTYGADGVAVIRTVMQAPNPLEIVTRMKVAMKKN